MGQQTVLSFKLARANEQLTTRIGLALHAVRCDNAPTRSAQRDRRSGTGVYTSGAKHAGAQAVQETAWHRLVGDQGNSGGMGEGYQEASRRRGAGTTL